MSHKNGSVVNLIGIKLTTHFSLSEMCRSATAERLSLDNTPTQEAIENLTYLCTNLLEPLREHLGVPLVINSAYRCPSLNVAVNGSTSSFHLYGCAADVRFTNADSAQHPLASIFRYVYNYLPFTEMIAENITPGGAVGWVHLALQRGREDEKALKYKLLNKRVLRGEYNEIMELLK